MKELESVSGSLCCEPDEPEEQLLEEHNVVPMDSNLNLNRKKRL